MKEYLLIVDTKDYSGNFERELCAWVTGRVGECGVGQQLAGLAVDPKGPMPMSKELWEFCEGHVEDRPDSHGCHRPCAISPTPGWFNDGLGAHHREGTDPEIVREQYNLSVREHAEHTQRAYADPEYGEQQAQDLLRRLDNPGRHPAYQSVEVYFDAPPPNGKLRNELSKRVQFFCAEHRPGGICAGRMGDMCSGPVTLTHIRLVERKTVVTDHAYCEWSFN